MLLPLMVLYWTPFEVLKVQQFVVFEKLSALYNTLEVREDRLTLAQENLIKWWGLCGNRALEFPSRLSFGYYLISLIPP